MDAETAPVDTSVEGVPWGPVVPAAAPGGELAFIDGAQQVEAWLTITAGGDPEARRGAAFAVAAGAVPPARARTRRDRGHPGAAAVVTVGDRRLTLAAGGGLRLGGARGRRERGDRARAAGGQLRQQMELALAEQLARPDRLVVLDGRLSFIRDAGGPGGRRDQEPPPHVPAGRRGGGPWSPSRVGQRTPLFAIGEDRLSWYQRLPGRRRRTAGPGSCAARRRARWARSRPPAWLTAPRPSCRASPGAPTAIRARRRTCRRSPAPGVAPAPPHGRPPPGAAGGPPRRARAPGLEAGAPARVAVAEVLTRWPHERRRRGGAGPPGGRAARCSPV